jgi:hypothetical protein
MNRVEGWILFAKWTLAEGERRLLGLCYGLAVLLLWNYPQEVSTRKNPS